MGQFVGMPSGRLDPRVRVVRGDRDRVRLVRRRGILSTPAITVAVLVTGSLTRSHDAARCGHAPNSDGHGAVTGSSPSQLVELDDSPIPVAIAWISRRALPRRTAIDRPRPRLPLQFRPHDGAGRRRIVDAGALRTPRLTSRPADVVRHASRRPGQRDDLRRSRARRSGRGPRFRCFVVRHRISR